MKAFQNITFGLFILAFSLALHGCEDECNSRSEVQVDNFKQDPYNFFINDSIYATIDGRGSILLTLKPGRYSFKMVQESGYDSIPNLKEEMYTADACTFATWGIYKND